MKKPRYKATEEGSLLDTRTGKTIDVAEFEVIQSGRIPVVKITPVEGKKLKIARYAIDETAYQFGPKEDTPPQPSQSALAVRPKAQVGSPVHAGNGSRLISFTREEAIQLLKATRATSDLLFTRLIEETVEKG